MNLAISNLAWENVENSKIIDILKELDVNAIEIAPTKFIEKPESFTQEELLSHRKYWNSNNISIVAMQSLLFGHPELKIFEDQKTREKTINYLEKIIMIAEGLGAGPLVFGSPKNRLVRSIEKAKSLDIAVGFFSKIAEIAEKHNTVFCIEANSKDYGCDFITGTLEAFELVKLVDHKNFGLHIDSGVMTLNNEDQEKVLEKVFPYIQHFHISEPFLKLITENKTPHKKLGQILRSLGYKKFVSIEMLGKRDGDNTAAVKSCLEFAIESYLG